MIKTFSDLWPGKEFLDRTQKAGTMKDSTTPPRPSGISLLGQSLVKNERSCFSIDLTKEYSQTAFPVWPSCR